MSEAHPEEDLVTVTIDGFEIAVPPGTLLIRAAEQLGIPIPRFCDHPLLDPVAACRQCLVEVSDMGNGRGMPKPPPACATTVMPGMVVETQFSSPTADKAQQGQMEFLLINHPLDCPVCDKGGECPLQNQAMSNGRSDTRFRDMKRTWPKPITVNANILLDRERCISCTRCFRFAEQIAGDPMLVMAERGWQQDIDTAVDEPFESYFSGNTIQICPVGALTSVSYRFRSRPFDLRSADSICEHCASGCALRTDFRRGKVTRRLAGEDNEVNEEWNCDKGRFAFTYATQDDRLVTPMVRDGRGQLVETTWPEALERAAEGLRAAVQNGGVGVLPGGRLTEEDAYAYAKFARVVLATNDIDCRARPGSNEELDFLAAHVAGTTPQQLSYSALEYAPTVLLVGFEAEEESPIVFLRLRKSTRLGRTKVYSIASLASNGLNKLEGILLPTRPGDEAAAIVDLPVVVRDALCLHGGVILAGERLASSPGAFSAVAALAADTGASLAWLPRRAGERGAVDAGALPNLLPGARPVVDPAARREVAAVWGVDIPARPGRDLDEILAAAGNRSLSGLVIGGLDPADLADPSGALDALASVGFVVSLELRHSAVTERADVVLPVAAAAEKSGRYVDWEGRRRSFDHFLESAAISDARTLDMLADEMDVNLGLRTLAATRDELARLGAWTDRPATPSTTPRPSPRPGIGELLLATWAEVLDAGRMQDGEPFLAATAKPARAVLASATATELGITNGDMVTVGTPGRSVVLPVELGGVLEGVIWLPTNAPGCPVRTVLRAAHGAVVRVARSTSLPVVGADPLAASGGQP